MANLGLKKIPRFQEVIINSGSSTARAEQSSGITLQGSVAELQLQNLGKGCIPVAPSCSQWCSCKWKGVKFQNWKLVGQITSGSHLHGLQKELAQRLQLRCSLSRWPKLVKMNLAPLHLMLNALGAVLPLGVAPHLFGMEQSEEPTCGTHLAMTRVWLCCLQSCWAVCSS